MCLLGACIAPHGARAELPSSERAALIELFDATNGLGWKHNDNWCSGPCPTSGAVTFAAVGTECSWFGVACDGAHTHVYDLYLSGNGLAGTLPNLSLLTQLGRLEVSDNMLTGTLAALSTMPQLGVFIGGRNRFDGQIPPLATLPNLAIFYVDHNQLSGAIPDLTGLRLVGFDVSHNQLTGAVPALPLPVIAHPWIRLCPNSLDTTPSVNDAGWNTYTGFAPWWAAPTAGSLCDDIFSERFESIPLLPI